MSSLQHSSSSLQHIYHPKKVGENIHAALTVFTTVVPEQEVVTAAGPLLSQLVSAGSRGLVVLDTESGSSNRTADVSTFAFEHAKGKMNVLDVSVISPDHSGVPHSALHLVPDKKNGKKHGHLVSRAVAPADKLLNFYIRQPDHAEKNAVLFFSTGATLKHCSNEEMQASLRRWCALGVSHIFVTEVALQKWVDGIVVAQNIKSAAPQSASSGARLRAFLLGEDGIRVITGIPNIHVMSGTRRAVSVGSRSSSLGCLSPYRTPRLM